MSLKRLAALPLIGTVLAGPASVQARESSQAGLGVILGHLGAETTSSRSLR